MPPKKFVVGCVVFLGELLVQLLDAIQGLGSLKANSPALYFSLVSPVLTVALILVGVVLMAWGLWEMWRRAPGEKPDLAAEPSAPGNPSAATHGDLVAAAAGEPTVDVNSPAVALVDPGPSLVLRQSDESLQMYQGHSFCSLVLTNEAAAPSAPVEQVQARLSFRHKKGMGIVVSSAPFLDRGNGAVKQPASLEGATPLDLLLVGQTDGFKTVHTLRGPWDQLVPESEFEERGSWTCEVALTATYKDNQLPPMVSYWDLDIWPGKPVSIRKRPEPQGVDL